MRLVMLGKVVQYKREPRQYKTAWESGKCDGLNSKLA